MTAILMLDTPITTTIYSYTCLTLTVDLVRQLARIQYVLTDGYGNQIGDPQNIDIPAASIVNTDFDTLLTFVGTYLQSELGISGTISGGD